MVDPHGTIPHHIRVIIVDDHPLVLDGLTTLLTDRPEFEILERCTTGAAAVAAVRRHDADILVLDLKLPDMDGLTVVRGVHEANPA